MATRHPHQGSPARLHSLLEWRALVEIAMLPFTWPLLGTAPQGDGHPVLLLPGFMADEITLVALKTFLRGRGYKVQTWGLGRNIGFQRRHAEALEQKIRHLHHQTGRKVSLVGWSLGGMFALYRAHQASECVRQIITLGSPVSVDAECSQSPALVNAFCRMIAHTIGIDELPVLDQRRCGAAAGGHGARGRPTDWRPGERANARYSWKLSRRHKAKTYGSGINSRQEVGEITARPS